MSRDRESYEEDLAITVYVAVVVLAIMVLAVMIYCVCTLIELISLYEGVSGIWTH